MVFSGSCCSYVRWPCFVSNRWVGSSTASDFLSRSRQDPRITPPSLNTRTKHSHSAKIRYSLSFGLLPLPRLRGVIHACRPYMFCCVPWVPCHPYLRNCFDGYFLACCCCLLLLLLLFVVVLLLLLLLLAVVVGVGGRDPPILYIPTPDRPH